MLSEQIIEVINELCAKFGIAIDWTAENILPMVEKALKQLVTYEITSSALVSVFSLIVFLASAIFIFKNLVPPKEWFESKDRKDTVFYEDCCGFEYTTLGGALMIVFSIVCGVSAIVFVASTDDLIQWIIMPDISIIKYITTLIK